MKKICMIATIVVFLAFIGGFGAAYLFVPQREFSPNENRYLQTLPDFSLSSLTAGRYIPAFETYLSDQVLFRDEWMSLRSQILLAAGNKDIGGVYIGRDGYLFEAVGDRDVFTDKFEENLAFVEAFAAARSGRTYVMLVPSASTVLRDNLPCFAPVYDGDRAAETASEALGSCIYIDLRGTLGNVSEQVYYRTDHHWTGWGAFAAYQTWCGFSGIEYRADKAPRLVSESFRGTLYSKVLLDSCAWDSIYAPEVGADVTVTADGKPIEMYNEAQLGLKDKYAYFFGGNYGQVTIECPSSDGGDLLIIKDSFANSFVPYIAEDYSTITMIDLRYFGGSVSQIAEGYDDVLILYGMSEFASDSKMFKLAY